MTVEVKITPQEKTSRVEVLVRFVLGIIFYFLMMLFGLVTGILVLVNFFTCLILAKRIAPEFIAKYIEWMAHIMAYFYFVTDERPPWTPM